MIRRVEFDAELVRLAVDAGSQLVSSADIVQAFVDGGDDNGKPCHARVARWSTVRAPVVIGPTASTVSWLGSWHKSRWPAASVRWT
jgi:hypothetical protein